MQKQNTHLRKPLSVELHVAVTLYYLSDEGRYRKTANAFGIAVATVSLTKLLHFLEENIFPYQQHLKMLSSMFQIFTSGMVFLNA